MQDYIFSSLYTTLFVKPELKMQDDALSQKIARIRDRISPNDLNIPVGLDDELVLRAGKDSRTVIV